MALTKSTVKYRYLGGSGTMKIWCTVYHETVKTDHPYRNIHPWAVPICLQIAAFAWPVFKYSPLALLLTIHSYKW